MNNFDGFIKIASRGTTVFTAFHGSEVLIIHLIRCLLINVLENIFVFRVKSLLRLQANLIFVKIK